jgi:macrolide transport system ATP-binding/permease protein
MISMFRKLWWLFQRRNKEAELQEEIQFHLDEESDEREAEGLGGDEARLAARRDFGNIAIVQEETRAAWTWTLWEQFVQDVRYSFRTMLANKSFTALAVLSLALGIGANTAIFSFMDSILLRTLPVPDSDSLVTLRTFMPKSENHGMNRHDNGYRDATGAYGPVFAYPAFEMLRDASSVFSTLFAYQSAGDVNVGIGRRSEIARGELVSGEYFRGLGIAPGAGSLILPDHDQTGVSPVVVLSFAASQKWFGDPSRAVGQFLSINNVQFDVIGVTPPEFFGVDPAAAPDLYLPMHTDVLIEPPQARSRVQQRYIDPNYEWLVVTGRLRPGITAAAAQLALSPQFSEWMRTVNTIRSRRNLPSLVVKETSGGLDGLRRRYSKSLYVLLTLVGLILAIACANIANLLLARAAARKREMGVRLSIGAGRSRIIRQLLTESIVLASLGGAVGVAIAVWGMRFITLLLANGNENFTLRAELNWHVLSVAAGLSILAGLLFGLAPALQSTRIDLAPALKASRTGGQGSRHFHYFNLSRILVAAQIAFTLLILVAAALFSRSLSNLESIQLGFNRESVLTFQLNARQAGHQDPEIIEFYSRLRKQFSELPGVRGATLSGLPLIGSGSSVNDVVEPGGKKLNSQIMSVGSSFFSTMQIPILLGREIDDRDRAGAPMVAVVNQTFAKKVFGDQNPIGRYVLQPGGCSTCNMDIEIVGLAADALYGTLLGPMPPVVFFPFMQSTGPNAAMVYELRTAGDPLSYIAGVRELVRQADMRTPVFDVKTQTARIHGTIGQEITFARLCRAFAILALAIACVGLYGTMWYNVARRTGEIGIRMALGAQRTRVVWMVLREVLLVVAVALAVSVPTALAASKLIESFLFGVTPRDSAAMVAAIAILVGATLIAGYLPARSASRIDPIIALRHD